VVKASVTEAAKLNKLRSISLCLLLLLIRESCLAVDPTKQITQYAHTAWRTQDGFFSGTISAITQTKDGYLWIGTQTGLSRFDGVRFVPWKPAGGNKVSFFRINALLGARDGSLWIGTDAGLSHFVDGVLIQYPDRPGGAIVIVERADGEIWFSHYDTVDASWGICKVVGARTQCYYGKNNGQPLAEDGLGSLWTGHGATITRWEGEVSSTYAPHGLRLPPTSGVADLAPARDGSMWVGMVSGGRGAGLQQFTNGVWKAFLAPPFDSSTFVVNALLLDRENALWIGTTQGIYRIRGRQLDHFGRSDGLSSDLVLYKGLYEDREGNVWVATSLGLDCFRDLPVTTYSSREGLPPEEVDSVLAARDGTVWVSGNQTLTALRQERTPTFAAQRVPGNQVTSLLEDHTGRLWVGVDDFLTIYKDGKFRRIDRPDGKPIGLIVGMTEGLEHNIWAETVGPPRTLFRIQDFKVQEQFSAPQMPAARKLAADPNGGIWLGLISGDLARFRNGKLEIFPFKRGAATNFESRVNQLLVASEGAVLGATNSGMIAWRDGRRQSLTVQNGLPCNGINSLIEDKHGNLWLSSVCGLVEILNTELQKWWQNPDTIVQFDKLDSLDGFRPDQVPFEGAARSPDGRLWFANGTVLQMIDPAHVPRNLIPPPLHIEEVIADRRSYAPGSKLRLPPITRDLEIDYTALSFMTPQKVHFRYKLEGRDVNWQEPGTRRQAFYSDLPPRNYSFHVIACNNDGVWNETGATLNFSVIPTWYQTIWFRISCAIGLVLLLWALYQLRLQRLQRQFNMTLEARVGERTRIARELHDTLLQSLHGLMFRFQAARNMLPGRPEQAMQAFDGAIARTEQAITESRNAIQDLRSEPVAQNSLAELLTEMGQELAAFENANYDAPVFRVIVEGERRRLSPILQAEVYGIARELLRNAFQHASSHRIEAEIRYEDHLFRLRVRDDGKGMDPKVLETGGRAGHWGLPGVRERAQKLGVRLGFWSQAGAGTEVQLSVPASIAYEKSRDSAGFRLFRKSEDS
jgi:signal transduction histidine kinase/ligand-binding sensor domain-containing protein